MTQNPITNLLDEHVIIMEKLKPLRDAVDALAARGDAALAETLPVLTASGN